MIELLPLFIIKHGKISQDNLYKENSGQYHGEIEQQGEINEKHGKVQTNIRTWDRLIL